MLNENSIETFTGVLTLIFICMISFFAFKDFRLFQNTGCTSIMAEFGDVGGLRSGNPIELFGVGVGSVVKVKADLKNYSAVVEMCIDNSIEIPEDSIIKVEDKSVLGERKLVLIPGIKTNTPLRSGQFIKRTQVVPGTGAIVGTFITKFHQ